MKLVRTVAAIREELEPLRGRSTIGLVPTMGALHAGHLSLFHAARGECGTVVASVFVNPAQFGDPADLTRYPRDERHDAELAAAARVDLLFVPLADEIYPPGYQTWVDVESLSPTLEGAFRPGHFRGVATVCLKLFNIVRPERAYFGQKDAQQAAVVKRLVRDLELELDVRIVPTQRDEDGLALSSRNVFLSPEQRTAALALPRALSAGAAAHAGGRDAAAAARAALSAEPLLDVEYAEVVDLEGQTVLAAAVRIGSTRLIDTVVLEVPTVPTASATLASKGAAT